MNLNNLCHLHEEYFSHSFSQLLLFLTGYQRLWQVNPAPLWWPWVLAFVRLHISVITHEPEAQKKALYALKEKQLLLSVEENETKPVSIQSQHLLSENRGEVKSQGASAQGGIHWALDLTHFLTNSLSRRGW